MENIKDVNPPTPPPVTLDDLEKLAANLDNSALTLDDENNENLSVNDKRIMYRFWLDESKEEELALMQWLDILKANRKFQPFVRLALRLAILETKGYIDKADDICDRIEEMFEGIDWLKE